MKTFTVAGTSKLNGVTKLRFANDLAGRVKVLERNGHEDIMLFDLEAELTKQEAALKLQPLLAKHEPSMAAVNKFLAADTPAAPKAKTKAKQEPKQKAAKLRAPVRVQKQLDRAFAIMHDEAVGPAPRAPRKARKAAAKAAARAEAAGNEITQDQHDRALAELEAMI